MPNANSGGFLRDSSGALVVSGAGAPTGGRLEAFGTSRSTGHLADNEITGPFYQGDRFPSKLAGMLGMGLVMHATAGAMLSWDENGAASGGGWCSLFHRVTRQEYVTGASSNQGWTSPNRVVTIADWVNDFAQVNGATAGTRLTARSLAIGVNTMRTLLSLACASKILEPTSSLITYGGTTAQVNVVYDAVRPKALRGAQAGPKGTRTMNTGATLSITLPQDYPGSAVCPISFIFAGDTGTTSGSVASSGAGVAVKTLDLTAANVVEPNGRRNPLCLRFAGSAAAPEIPAGATTVTLTATVTGNPARFVRCIVEAAEPPTVLAYNTAKINPWDSAIFWPWVVEADYDGWNSLLQTTCGEWGSHVKYIDVNTIMGGTKPLSTLLVPYISDGMHHTALGTAEYARLGYQAVTQGAADTSGDRNVMLAYPTPAAAVETLREFARRARCPQEDFFAEAGISANQSIADNTATAVSFDQELIDHSMMHPDGQLTRFYCVHDGVHQAVFACGFDGTVATGLRVLSGRITRRDGTLEPIIGNYLPTASTNAILNPKGTITMGALRLYVGDYVEFLAYQNSGAPMNIIQGDTKASLKWIGEL